MYSNSNRIFRRLRLAGVGKRGKLFEQEALKITGGYSGMNIPLPSNNFFFSAF